MDERICAYCDSIFKPVNKRQRFCTASCEKQGRHVEWVGEDDEREEREHVVLPRGTNTEKLAAPDILRVAIKRE